MEKGKIEDGLERTLSTQPSDPFYIANAETTPNELVMHGKQDSPRIQTLKVLLPILVAKISDKDPKASLVSLDAELKELLRFFREIMENNEVRDLNVLKLSLRQLGVSGHARLQATIRNCQEISEETRELMRKIVLEEALRQK